MQKTAQISFLLTGWKVDQFLPPSTKQCVLVVAPHTSGWDLFYGRMAFFLFDRPAFFLIKDDYMRTPLKPLLTLIGGIGVDRSRSNNLTSDLVSLIREREEIVMAITPEGTRDISMSWKTGFYHTAMEAGVPIALMYLDYKRKRVGISQPFMPSGEFESDMQYIEDCYSTVCARYPQKYNPMIFTRTGREEKWFDQSVIENSGY